MTYQACFQPDSQSPLHGLRSANAVPGLAGCIGNPYSAPFPELAQSKYGLVETLLMSCL